MPNAAEIFALHATIEGDTDKLEKDIARVKKSARELGAELSRVSNAKINSSGLSGFEKQAKSVSKSVSGIMASFGGNVASTAFSAITAKVVETGKALLDYSSRMEQTKIGFTTLMGGAANATKHLEDLKKFATETPFEFEGLAKMSQRLQGVGVDSQKVIPLIKNIGNIAAATGDIGAERLEGINTAVSQMISKTKVSAEEMEQLAERGVPAWAILSDSIGKTQAETRKLSEQGKISSSVMVDALNKMGSTKFAGAMEKQSKTFAGSMSTISDIAMQTGETLFKPIYEEIGQFSNRFATSLQSQEAAATGTGGKWAFALGESLGDSLRRGIDSSRWQAAASGGGSGVNYGANILNALTADLAAGLDKGANSLTAATGGMVDMSEATSKAAEVAQMADATFQSLSKRLETTASLAATFASEFTRVKEAMLKSVLTSTSGQELENTKEIAKIQADGIKTQIRLAKQGFAEKLELYRKSGKDASDIGAEQQKILLKLNNDLFISELNAQKDIAEKEKQIYQGRLSAAIDFKKQTVSALRFNLDTSNFNFDNFTVASSDAFSRLKDETSKTYAEIGRLISEQNSTQLSELGLTSEKRISLIREGSSEQIKLAEELRQKIIGIDDQMFDARKRNLEEYSRFASEKLSIKSDYFSSLGSLFKSDVFASIPKNTLQDILIGGLPDAIPQINKDLAKLAQGFGNTVDGIKNLDKAQETIIKGRFSVSLSEAQSSVDAVTTAIENLGTQASKNLSQKVIDIEAKIDFKVNERTKIANDSEIFDAVKKQLTEGLDAEIKKLQIDKEALKNAGAQVDENAKRNLETQLGIALEKKKNIEVLQGAQLIAAQADSYENLWATVAAFKNGSKTLFDVSALEAGKQVAKDLIGGFQEIEVLKQRIANINTFSALDIEKAKLQEIIALRNTETAKIIEGNQSLKYRLAMMSAELPTISNQIKDSFGNVIEGISSSLANAVTSWDGTFSGFLKSVASNFAQTMQSIINELIRVAVMKFILDMIAKFSGGGSSSSGIDGGSIASASGGGASIGSHFGGGSAPGFARGGFTGNIGADKIAGFVHGNEYVMPANVVKKFGLGFMDSVKNLQMPQAVPSMALAGGGMMPNSATTNNNQKTINVTVNVPSGNQSNVGNTGLAKEMLVREIIKAIRTSDSRSK